MLRFFNYKDKKLKLKNGADLVVVDLIAAVVVVVQTVAIAKV